LKDGKTFVTGIEDDRDRSPEAAFGAGIVDPALKQNEELQEMLNELLEAERTGQ